MVAQREPWASSSHHPRMKISSDFFLALIATPCLCAYSGWSESSISFSYSCNLNPTLPEYFCRCFHSVIFLEKSKWLRGMCTSPIGSFLEIISQSKTCNTIVLDAISGIWGKSLSCCYTHITLQSTYIEPERLVPNRISVALDCLGFDLLHSSTQ